MKWLPLCALYISCFVSGQNRVEKLFPSKDISGVEFIGDEIYSITINNSSSPFVKIISHSEGEYANAIDLETTIDESVLKIGTSIQSGFNIPNDKLSAHKVFATELTLFVPKHLLVRIESHLSSVKIKGSFPFLSVYLYEGNCSFENFEGTAIIQSVVGSIYGKTSAATIKAFSKNGKVFLPKNLPSGNVLTLNSTQGNIEILQTKI